jgi:hypothetical protein
MLDDLDLTMAERLAHVSSERPNSRGWTELTLYQGVGDGIIAEIVGETRVEGQERRVRRASFASVADALGWKAFDQDSLLFNELRNKVIARLGSSGRRSADGEGFTVDARRLSQPHTVMLLEDGRYRFVPVDGPPWDGQGGFRGAMIWLYGDDMVLGDLCDRWADDWGDSGFDGKDAYDAVIDTEAGGAEPRLVETFCKAMRHFRKESFHARLR